MKLTHIAVRLPHAGTEGAAEANEDADMILTAHLARMGAVDIGVTAYTRNTTTVGVECEAMLPDAAETNTSYITHVPRERRQLPMSDWTPA